MCFHVFAYQTSTALNPLYVPPCGAVAHSAETAALREGTRRSLHLIQIEHFPLLPPSFAAQTADEATTAEANPRVQEN